MKKITRSKNGFQPTKNATFNHWLFTFAVFLLLGTWVGNAATWYSNNATSGTIANTLTNWSANTNGTGANPANFTTASDIFVIQSGHQYHLNAAWTGAGTGVIQIQSGGSLDIKGFNIATFNRIEIAGSGVGITGALINTGGARDLTRPITLTGAATITANGTGTLTLSGAISYAGNTLTIAGSQATAVTAASTLTANSTIVSSGAGLTISAGITSAGFTFTIDGASATTLSQVITGTGALTKNGAGTLTVTAAQTFTGATTINNGTLKLNGSGRIADTSALTVTSPGIFDLGGLSETVGSIAGTGTITSSVAGNIILTSGNASNTTFSGVIQNGTATSLGITKLGAGTLTLSGTNTFTGVTTISAGTISVATIGNGGTAGNLGQATNAAANLVLGGGTLQYTGATASTDRSYTLSGGTASTIDVTTNNLTISGASTNTNGALTKSGAGILILSGANLHTGITTVSAGTLRYGAANALSTGAVTVNDGGTYDLNGFSDSIGALTVNSGATGGTVTTGAGTLTLGANVTSTGGASNASISGNLALGANIIFTTTNAADGLSISAVISGGFTFSKAGAGTLTLSGNNTYTGITTVNGGTLSIGADNNLGAVPGAVTATSLTLNGGTLKTTASFTLSTNRGITLGASSGTIEPFSTSSLTYGGVIAGANNLTKIGSGALILLGNNTFSGTTTVTAGELRFNPSVAAGTYASQIIMNGGTLSTTGIATGTTLTSSSTLKINENASINLGSNVHSLKFANSSGIAWVSGKTVTVGGWTGTAGVSGTAGKLFSGTTAAHLTSAQLAQITFSGYTGASKILATGEVVPYEACVTPSAQPTSLVLSSVTKTTLSGSFTAASPAPSKYLVVRSTSSTAPTPVNGTAYTAGTALGTGEVIQASASTSFTDSGLYAGTTYYYYIFSYNDGCSGEPYYNTTSPLTNNTTTLAPTIWYVDNGSNTNDVYTALKSDGITAGIAGNDTTGDGTLDKPYATLNKAYSMVAAGDIIYVDTGSYVQSSPNPNVTFNKSDVQILGAGVANTSFTSGSSSGTVYFGKITASNLTFKDLSITGYDRGADGIAVEITSGTNILFDQCNIYANVGSGGQGAVYIEGVNTEVTFTNTSLPCNRVASANYGGALKIAGSTVRLYNCSLNNNVISALNGGAIFISGYTVSGSYVGGANVTIDSCTFDGNGSSNGGAIAIYGDGSATATAYSGGTVNISNSCFDSNITNTGSATTTDGGAAIYVSHANDGGNLTVNISNSTFTNNSSSSHGGALLFRGGTGFTATVTTCSFGTNSASNGEDIYFYGDPADITFKNTTFSSLYASGVNLFNRAMGASSIKFEGLSSASGTGACGDIVADGSGVAGTKPEISGVYTESSSSVPTSLPSPTCNDRFDGTCGTTSATFACATTNIFDDITSSATILTGRGVTGTTTVKNITTGGISRSGNTLTINSTAHGFIAGNWVVVAGNSVTDYNRAYKIQSASTNSFTVSVANITSLVTASATSTVSGTVTKGTVALGWSRETIPTVFEHVIINYDYNTTTYGNIDACQMTVNSGKTLVVDNDSSLTNGVDTNGTYVYVVNSIFNNGTINVYNNGSLIQVNHPLDMNGENISTPNISITKTTGTKYRWDYVYWSKPFASGSSIMSNFSTAFDLKYYWDSDYSVNIDRSYEGWRTLSGEPTVGTGFITRVKNSAPYNATPTAITIGPMSGTSTNGDYTATVKYYDGVDTKFRNFTLLGNPYPGSLDFTAFYNANSDSIYGTAYLWTSYTVYPGIYEYRDADYATFNLSGGVAGEVTQSPTSTVPNGYIPSGQAFMVRPKVNGTVTFSNSQRSKVIPSNNQFFRKNLNKAKDRFWLQLTDDKNRGKEQLIAYTEAASAGFDEAYDGPLNTASTFKFYSKLGTDKLSIQGKGKFEDTDATAIAYEIPSSIGKTYTLTLSNKEGIFNENQKIYVFDKELNYYHDLSHSPYRFTGTANSQNRFEIVYRTKDQNTITTAENMVVAVDNNTVSFKANENITQIYLYDMSGKVIFAKILDEQAKDYSATIMLSEGVYIAKVVLTNNKTVSKKIIKG